MKRLKINCPMISKVLVNFLQDGLKKSGLKNFVIGLSGGIDSAVVCALAVKAVKPDHVYAIAMPYKISNPDSTIHARELAEKLGVNFKIIEITPMIDAYFDKIDPEASQLRRGNKMARERMTILYDHSAKYQGLVIGTSNKTETLLGYGTLFGDTAWALNPIGNLYKNQIYQLAKFLEIPASIINKPPSADLWHGQTDEEELGCKYDDLDKFLYLMIDKKISQRKLQKEGFSLDFINKVSLLMKKTHFKRKPGVVARLS